MANQSPNIGAFNGQSLPPLSPTDLSEAIINTNSSGDNLIVAAVAGKIVRVYAMFFVAAGTVTVQAWDGPSNTGTALTGVMSLVAGIPILDLQYWQYPYFTTSVGNGFNLKLGSGVQISGRLYYLQG